MNKSWLLVPVLLAAGLCLPGNITLTGTQPKISLIDPENEQTLRIQNTGAEMQVWIQDNNVPGQMCGLYFNSGEICEYLNSHSLNGVPYYDASLRHDFFLNNVLHASVTTNGLNSTGYQHNGSALIRHGTSTVAGTNRLVLAFEPYPDTSYVVTLIGIGSPVGSCWIVSKTTTNCQFQFDQFTGQIDWQIVY